MYQVHTKALIINSYVCSKLNMSVKKWFYDRVSIEHMKSTTNINALQRSFLSALLYSYSVCLKSLKIQRLKGPQKYLNMRLYSASDTFIRKGSSWHLLTGIIFGWASTIYIEALDNASSVSKFWKTGRDINHAKNQQCRKTKLLPCIMFLKHVWIVLDSNHAEMQYFFLR